MKKFCKIFLTALMLTLGTVSGAGLSTNGSIRVQAAEDTKPYIQLQYDGRKEFRLSADEIRQGDTGKLTFRGKAVTDLKWSSSRPGILTVDAQGNVEAKRAGTAVVTAKYTYQNNVYNYSVTIQVVDRWAAEQKKFPSGSYWNDGEDNNKVTSTPCTHEGDSCKSNRFVGIVAGREISGSQCHGFALKVASDLYGSLAQWSYCSTYRSVQAGDVIRINGSHTIIVTKVFDSTIQYADCNGNGDCQIKWGNTMSKEALRAAFTYMYTRR